MNKNIVDFKLGNNKGIFVGIPYRFKNFTIEQYPVSGTYLMETDSKELNHWKTKIPKGDYRYVGRSNELSPEFVESELNVPFEEYITMLNELSITVNYSDHSNFWAVLLTEREDLILKQLQQCAIHNVMARTSDANNATMATRIGELNSLHIAASMDIEKTTESLKEILAYKKEAAKQMLRCSDETQMAYIAEVLKQADYMLVKVLGMYVP